MLAAIVFSLVVLLYSIAHLDQPAAAWQSDRPVAPQSDRLIVRLLGDFEPGWADDWMVEELDARATRYRAAEEGGNVVLRAESNNSASAFYRRLLVSASAGTVSWRWKVERSLAGNTEEREQRGDDYAARLFVIFGPELFGRNTKALCYVWAGNEAIDSLYESPYTDGVATIVVRSGNERAGTWTDESRDFAQDYRRAFGEEPPNVRAVAVMVDTDDTSSQATAWFDDIVLTFTAGSRR